MPDIVHHKIKRLLTQGWSITSEPLKVGEVKLESYGCLKAKIRFKGCSPNTLYTIGLNVYGVDLPIFGRMKRLAFNSGTKTVDGVSKYMVNEYILGTITMGKAGEGKFKTILPVSPGLYDIQMWISKGPVTADEAPTICYKSGETFGDSEIITVIDGLDKVYTVDYFQWHVQYKQNYREIVEIIYKKFKPKSVIDVGCGCGWFLEFFHNKGVLVTGIDGSTNALEYVSNTIKNKILIRDITKSLKTEHFDKYDLCSCVEVGEEIDTEYSDILVDNLVHLSNRIFFTAAQPHDGGRHHINRQRPEFWLKRFAKHGFELNAKTTEEIKAEIQQNIQDLYCSWIVRNLMVVENMRTT